MNVMTIILSILSLLLTHIDIPLWRVALEPPETYVFESSAQLQGTYRIDDLNVEVLIQRNGPDTYQRVFKVFPVEYDAPLPAVVVPFYFPEAMLGCELDGTPIEKYSGIEMMKHLASRGFACISADAYHLTYKKSDKSRGDFSRWKDAGETLLKDYPDWSGMGKLVADTRLLIDLLEEDVRIDKERIGMTGHSLGGKIAFYTGCLDQRIKAVVASDFGFLWEQSNWEKPWYWGTKLENLKSAGITNTDILSSADGKPFMLIAGLYDNDNSFQAMLRAESYADCRGNLVFINHASGHRPPRLALESGYDFLGKYLNQ